jgi:rRNA small subunit methyltransferase G
MMSITEGLNETLRLAQRLGFFGPGDLQPAIAHAGHFTTAIPAGTRLLMDLGSGGGLPALVIAQALPDVSLRLIERRQTRADFLERAVRRLSLTHRVTVVTSDVQALASDPNYAGTADVVTARGFGSPSIVAPIASSLLRLGGTVIVSDPPGTLSHERWLRLPLDQWNLEFVESDGVVSTLRRTSS